MKIENQVCSYESAKKLKELGVAQESYWSWAHEVERMHESFNGEVREWEAEYKEEPTLVETSLAQFDGLPHFAAYTVAELGEMLPTGYDTMAGTLTPSKREWLGYDRDGNYCPGITAFETEAQCRAAMLIHLLEQNLISPDEINKRLKQ